MQEEQIDARADITPGGKPHEFKVSGTLDFDTIESLLTRVRVVMQQAAAASAKIMTFDFSGISHSNSAGLAFLLNILREAKQLDNLSVQFLHLPATLIAAAKISDLEGLLPDAPEEL